ncbi:hypothetical protein [Flavobacterium sp. UMI-01]|uniref:hypothetical protein n=1 Tax=Flavobacterium sp. UMI-01 TaxID=1441053 RepID=UPI001C7D96F3|nr:hypothetical protein [Flavobacterium sp. UMI-01]GIZ09731.1 hypothetical protein FUMI01_24580 [Flavobacterium sp. UMI-01]
MKTTTRILFLLIVNLVIEHTQSQSKKITEPLNQQVLGREFSVYFTTEDLYAQQYMNYYRELIMVESVMLKLRQVEDGCSAFQNGRSFLLQKLFEFK